ncbi:hypothetical protein KAH39_03895 [Alcaligenes faecalis]|uniref:hypothetical protein n=1 Tax=Alcaligenes faecalis TaxID=511 RepID=UPI000F660685|nr:hypothetical protein [Alcaligenes faecalis]MBQ0216447.1 hypothetical protein [Alcaligenes faecalis]
MRDTESAISPYGAVRPKASLSSRESWQCPGFMAVTVQQKQFPLRWRAFLARQILFAYRFSTAFRPQAVLPARSPPDGSQQGRDGRELV